MNNLTPAGAEVSKNNVLEQVRFATEDFRQIAASSIGHSVMVIATTIYVVLMLLIIIVIYVMYYLVIISLRRAVLIVTIFAVLLLAALAFFVYYTQDLAFRTVGLTVDVFNNFAASEDAVILLNNAAIVYLANSPVP